MGSNDNIYVFITYTGLHHYWSRTADERKNGTLEKGPDQHRMTSCGPGNRLTLQWEKGL